MGPAWQRAAAGLLAALLLAAPPAAAEDDPTRGLPLPPGTRAVERGPEASETASFRSGRGFRATVKYYSRRLARRGASHRAIAAYRHRGVDLARFLATGEESPWAAIHVYRQRGTTYIAIVGGPPLDLGG